jgi:hypothetical protein
VYLYLFPSPLPNRNAYARRNRLKFKRADILECLTNQTGAYEKHEKNREEICGSMARNDYASAKREKQAMMSG